MIESVKGGAGIVIIIILLIILGIGAFVVIQSGTLEKAVDPCAKQLDSCNYGCGDGILSSLCKEKCSYDYRSCKNG